MKETPKQRPGRQVHFEDLVFQGNGDLQVATPNLHRPTLMMCVTVGRWDQWKIRNGTKSEVCVTIPPDHSVTGQEERITGIENEDGINFDAFAERVAVAILPPEGYRFHSYEVVAKPPLSNDWQTYSEHDNEEEAIERAREAKKRHPETRVGVLRRKPG